VNDSLLHPLGRAYLKRLKKAARHLSRARRNELIGEIESHLTEALPASASEIEARNVLERLGEPAEIVAEAEPGSREAPEARAGIRESLAVSLLLFGGLLFVVGWFVGLHLLWSSRFWTLREKLIGTFVVPGGLLPALVLVATGGQTCTGGTGQPTTCTPYISPTMRVVIIAGWVALVVLPLASAVFLSWRSGKARVALP
jgi:uncharacterized membrane protein